MTLLIKIKAAQAALNDLLETVDIHVNSEVGDALLLIISELDEAEKLATQLSTYYKLNRQELGAVLAGLRLLQCEIPFDGNIPTQIEAIFNDEGSFTPLNIDEIDDLCVSMNEANGPDQLPTELNFDLDDWQSEDNAGSKDPLSIKLSIRTRRIDLSVNDGRTVWIEQRAGVLRLHSYLPDSISDQEPVNLNISLEEISVSGKVTFEIS